MEKPLANELFGHADTTINYLYYSRFAAGKSAQMDRRAAAFRRFNRVLNDMADYAFDAIAMRECAKIGTDFSLD